eukprot:TRINITY_DN428_c0_g1_i1.p1 TRINITY_DN428_c0_g1~~TRINITY_DN428_c0_g1_i1.p1  ORF type:complete len:303 (-),score=69.36 TRINITY_DN428_c0_g1_i1:57-905(-)
MFGSRGFVRVLGQKLNGSKRVFSTRVNSKRSAMIGLGVVTAGIAFGTTVLAEPRHATSTSGQQEGTPCSCATHDCDVLLKHNEEWAERISRDNPTYFANLAKGQTPKYLLIGCADSRVPPDQLFQTQPGDIFIHRNVANVVVATDMNLMSVLQYAVEVLKVQRVIVMGHSECGGVRASMSDKSFGLIDNWLRNIKDVYRLHKAELDSISDESKRYQRLTELHVMEQVVNLEKTTIIQRARAEGHNVTVHGFVCDISSGRVRDLHCNESPLWKSVEQAYKYSF